MYQIDFMVVNKIASHSNTIHKIAAAWLQNFRSMMPLPLSVTQAVCFGLLTLWLGSTNLCFQESLHVSCTKLSWFYYTGFCAFIIS